MAKLTPRNVAVTDQVLAVLDEAYPLPVSTGEVEERTGYGIRYGQLAYRMLQRLADLGDVEKITVPEMRSRYWRRWPQDRDGMACRISCGYTWTATEPRWRAQVLPGA